jgi:hypothetical protein
MIDKQQFVIKRDNNYTEIQVNVQKANKYIIVVLSIIIAIGVFIPFFILFYFSNLIKPSFIFGFVIFLGVSFYFFKLLLWNLFGKEIYKFREDSVDYVCDYRCFTSNKHKILVNNYEILIIDEYLDEYSISNIKKVAKQVERKYLLFFKIANNDSFRTSVKLQANEVISFLEILNEKG